MVWTEARRSGTLYLAAVVVSTINNPGIKMVYQRLCGVGKVKKVARSSVCGNC